MRPHRPAGRTAWGDPDIQGVFTFSTITPLQRPDDVEGRAVLTAEEAASFEAETARQRVDRAPRPGDTGTYNRFWVDYGTQVVGDRATSLIFDPQDGRLPAMSAAAREQADARRAAGSQPPASHEDLSITDRCIMGFNAGPPFVPSAYNNTVQLLQTPDYVVILNEMIHDARLVPLDGRPPVDARLRQWMGDARGRWEGDTLVVETTNFSSSRDMTRGASTSGATPTRAARSRRHASSSGFSRLDDGSVRYEFTVDDPRHMDPALVRDVSAGGDRRRAVRVRLPRRQLLGGQHPGGRARRRAGVDAAWRSAVAAIGRTHDRPQVGAGRAARWRPRTLALAALVAACGAPGGDDIGAEPALDGIPRTPDGRPDFNGVWQAFTTASWNILDHNAQKGVPAGQGIVAGNEIPYQPWAAEQQRENYENRADLDPLHNCYLPGVPRIMYMPYPYRINQTPELIAITFEYSHAFRWIWTDGSDHPEALEFWMADSRRPLGGRYAGGERGGLQQPHLVRPRRQLPQRAVAAGGAVHAHGPQPHPLRGDGRRSGSVHAPLGDADGAVPADGRKCADARLRVPGVRGDVPALGRAAGARHAGSARSLAAAGGLGRSPIWKCRMARRMQWGFHHRLRGAEVL